LSRGQIGSRIGVGAPVIDALHNLRLINNSVMLLGTFSAFIKLPCIIFRFITPSALATSFAGDANTAQSKCVLILLPLTKHLLKICSEITYISGKNKIIIRFAKLNFEKVSKTFMFSECQKGQPSEHNVFRKVEDGIVIDFVVYAIFSRLIDLQSRVCRRGHDGV
jgi:hypothetical protein